MSYDHAEKSGNQGDIVKHVALMAALDVVLTGHQGETFRFADAFCGYAFSPLIRGNEWRFGLARLMDKQERLKENSHCKLWAEWYLPRGPRIEGCVYPGSSTIAADMCRLKGKDACLSMWDISPKVVEQLVWVYKGQNHNVHYRPSRVQEEEIRHSDFLLVDPPSHIDWKEIAGFFGSEKKPFSLVWLPVNANTTTTPPSEDSQSIEVRQNAKRSDIHSLRVRWAAGGRTIGCVLLGKMPDDAWEAVKAAVAHVVQVVGWELPARLNVLEQ